jgi:hypothetical protein
MAYCGTDCCSANVEGKKTAVTLVCRSWGCDDCAPERKKQLFMKAKSGQPNIFLTLTSRVTASLTPEQAAKDLVWAYRTWRRQLERKNKNLKLEFIAVFEATKAGWPHLHILIRGKYIERWWISQQMERLTNSPEVDIRAIRNRKGMAAYLMKYIRKAPAKFGTLKRYWCTPGWELGSKIKGRVKQNWTREGMTISQWANMWSKWGYSITWDGLSKVLAEKPP